MTRLASIGVKKISTTNYLPYDKATIYWVNKNLDNRLPSIMTRLPSIRVTKSQQRTTFHNDKAIIQRSNKISTAKYLPY